MSTVVQAANPLPFLLEEERHGDHQATEAILLKRPEFVGGS